MVSMSDLSFTVTGFLSAAVANCCFATRSLVVKDVLARGLLDNLNLFYYISWLSAAAVLVFSVPLELQILRTHWHLIDRHLVGLALVHGFLHYFYNQMSMVILSHVAALTHSVSNAARRFFIIMVNVMLYGHRLTHGNQFGLGRIGVEGERVGLRGQCRDGQSYFFWLVVRSCRASRCKRLCL